MNLLHNINGSDENIKVSKTRHSKGMANVIIAKQIYLRGTCKMVCSL